MIVTCVTSRYLPNLRYIARLCEVDRAVVLDLAALPRQGKTSFVSRNRISNRLGDWIWLSVPIRRKGIKLFSDARVEETQKNWIDKHIRTLEQTYPNHSEIAGDFLSRLRDTLMSSDGNLLDLNFRSLNLILELLELDNEPLVLQSSIIETHSKMHRLEVAQSLAATTYVAGHVEWNVMNDFGCIQRMNTSGIKVIKSPELDPVIFPINEVRYLSCVHTICTIGAKETRKLIDKIVLSLVSEAATM